MLLTLLAVPLAAQQRPVPAPRPAPPDRAALIEYELQAARAAELVAQAAEVRIMDLSRAARLQTELAARTTALEMTTAMLETQAREVELMAREMAPWSAGGLASLRPQAGTQEDSLYRVAREALNRGEYLRAAQLFQEYQSRFPNARTAPAALYWRAFALHRAGSDANLRAALASLESQRNRYPATVNDVDAAALRLRILATLAARGDQQAAAEVRAAGAQGASCDREEMEVRAEALNALVRQDPASARAVISRVLAQRDECSVTLRRRAVYHLGRQAEGNVASRLVEVARNDPDRTVRTDAIALIGRLGGDQTIRHLEQIFAGTSDERVKIAVFTALRSHSSPEASRLLRRYIEDRSLSDGLRANAVSALLGGTTIFAGNFEQAFGARGRALAAVGVEPVIVDGRVTALDRTTAPAVVSTAPLPPTFSVAGGEVYVSSGGGRIAATDEDAAFLRNLYPRETSRAVKDAIISGLARMGGEANERWLMGIARNESEEMHYRTAALARMNAARVPVSELIALYDVASDRTLRTSIIHSLGTREEDAATDKLFAIARSGTDPVLRRQAITALSRKNDPRITRLLLELIER
jgi:outer membrane protein assembly factor BamD (BamD/ComL family)